MGRKSLGCKSLIDLQLIHTFPSMLTHNIIHSSFSRRTSLPRHRDLFPMILVCPTWLALMTVMRDSVSILIRHARTIIGAGPVAHFPPMAALAVRYDVCPISHIRLLCEGLAGSLSSIL